MYYVLRSLTMYEHVPSFELYIYSIQLCMYNTLKMTLEEPLFCMAIMVCFVDFFLPSALPEIEICTDKYK